MEKSTKRTIVWILNGLIALLCILAIAGYFFGPFWKIDVTYNMDAEAFDKLIGNGLDMDVDADEIVGEEGVDIRASIAIGTADLLQSFNPDENAAIEKLIDSNVDNIVAQLNDSLKAIAEATVRSVAKSTVQKQVKDNVREHLASVNPDNGNLTDEEISQRLQDANITDEYIAEKTDEIIDSVYEGQKSVEEVSDEVVSVVEEVYGKLQESDDEELKSAELTDSAKQSIRDAVADELDKLADENGEINPDELLENLLKDVLGSLSGKAKADGPATLAAGDDDDLNTLVKDYIMGKLPANLSPILVWVMRGAAILFFFSSLSWLYILIKLIVKLATGAKEPTVKLKAPIWLGWLPFLLFALLPTLAFALLRGPLNKLLPEALLSILGSVTSLTFTSIGWIAFAAACVCLVLSIFYIILRKRGKKNSASDNE